MGSLRRQSLLLTTLILVICITLGTTISYYIIERSMREFESRDSIQTQKRINILLSQEMSNIAKQAADYAVWSATYEFMENFDSSYIDENYTQEIFENLNIDYIYIIRNSGSIAMAMTRTNLVAPGATTGIRNITDAKSLELTNLIIRETAKTKAPNIGSFISLHGQQYIYGINEILTTNGDGPSRGKVLFIRLIDPQQRGYLESLAQEDFSLNSSLSKEHIDIGQDRIESTMTLFNTISNPVAMVEVNQERPLKQLIGATRLTINTNALVLTLIALLFVYLMFDRVVLRKIDLLVRNIFSIRQAGVIGKFLPLIGNQDIDRISSEVNCMLVDLSDSHRRLEYEAFHDYMTGLGNRRLLLRELEIASNEVLSGKIERFALMLMDLDDFKDINDIHGHVAGDFIITTVANRLRSKSLEPSIPIRIGGDEFAVIFKNYPLPSSELVAKCMLETVTGPVDWNGYPLMVSASIGITSIASAADAQLKPIDLLRKADIAMYASKNNGKNGYVLFHADHEKAINDHKRLESELSLLIANHSVDVWMQPIHDSMSGKVFALEVLARWFHPKLGEISPRVFIALAENMRVIPQLDRSIIRKACITLVGLHQANPELRICINISALTLQDDDIVDFIKSILIEFDFPEYSLLFEITETMLASNESRLAKHISELRELGIQFLIDDFGTGYSSLSRLQALPLDFIKIDRSFIHSLETHETPVCKTIIQLAHSLDMKVIAEGVETEAQHRRLIDLNCNYAQGYYFAKPMNADNLTKYLASR